MPWLMHRTSGSCCRLLQGQKGLRLRPGGHDGSLLDASCKPYFIRIRHSDRATTDTHARKAIVCETAVILLGQRSMWPLPDALSANQPRHCTVSRRHGTVCVEPGKKFHAR